jgi:predicted DNA-binding transcriptional regulator AlpA
MKDMIGATALKKRLGVSRTQFDRMVARGCFGNPVFYGERSQRYFDADAVETWFKGRERESRVAAAIASRVLV